MQEDLFDRPLIFASVYDAGSSFWFTEYDYNALMKMDKKVVESSGKGVFQANLFGTNIYIVLRRFAAGILWSMAFGTSGEAYNVTDEGIEPILNELTEMAVAKARFVEKISGGSESC